MSITRSVTSFDGISPAAFQHPDDDDASAAIRHVPMFPQILKFVMSHQERFVEIDNLTSSLKLGPNQCRSIYSEYAQAAKVLDVNPIPDLHLRNGPVNAYAYGINRPIIMIFSGLLEALNQDEIIAVLGHELGHVKCKHMLNKTLAHLLSIGVLQTVSRTLPLIGPASMLALHAALFHWSRRAEISCDRAAMLAVQDERIVASALGKLAGWSHVLDSSISLEALLEQSRRYDDYDAELDTSAYKAIHAIGNWDLTHPFPISRVARILEWGKSDQYRSILAGEYPRNEHKAAAMGKQICSGCGNNVAEESQYCTNCGAPSGGSGAYLECPKCKSRTSKSSRHCPSCGHGLEPS